MDNQYIYYLFNQSITYIQTKIVLYYCCMLSSKSKAFKNRVLTESDGPFAKLNGEILMPWDAENGMNIYRKFGTLLYRR